MYPLSPSNGERLGHVKLHTVMVFGKNMESFRLMCTQ